MAVAIVLSSAQTRLVSQRRGRDLNPRSALRRITVFETAAFDRSATPPGAPRYLTGASSRGAATEAEKEGFEPSMEVYTPITP